MDTYRLDSSPELGRYLVANRAIKPGDIIMKEYPLAAAPGPLSEHVCFACHGHFHQPFVCRDCSSPLCSRDCQSSPEHQKECALLVKIIPELVKRQQEHGNKLQSVQLSLLMLPLRLLLLRLEQPEKWKLLLDLEAHTEARKKSPVWGFIERNITPYMILMFAEQMPDLTNDLVQQICGAVDVNSFDSCWLNGTEDEWRFVSATDQLKLLVTNDMKHWSVTAREVLRGTYYTASLMAHSCVVNAQISITDDSLMFVKATVPIQEGEGIFVSYTDPLQTTLQRRNILEKGKHFICRCQRCQDPTEMGTFASAIRCLSCPSGWVVPHDDPKIDPLERGVCLVWKCSQCNAEMDKEVVARTEDVLQNIVKNVQRLPVDRHLIDRCEELFVSLSKKVHSNHALLLQLRVSLIHLYGNVPGFLIPELPPSLLERKAQLCKELLKCLDYLCPGFSRLRGIMMYESHVPLVCLASKMFEEGKLTSNQLIHELENAQGLLKDSIKILIHEPISTPESHIAKTAMADLKQLRNYISDMEKLKLLTN